MLHAGFGSELAQAISGAGTARPATTAGTGPLAALGSDGRAVPHLRGRSVERAEPGAGEAGPADRQASSTGSAGSTGRPASTRPPATPATATEAATAVGGAAEPGEDSAAVAAPGVSGPSSPAPRAGAPTRRRPGEAERPAAGERAPAEAGATPAAAAPPAAHLVPDAAHVAARLGAPRPAPLPGDTAPASRYGREKDAARRPTAASPARSAGAAHDRTLADAPRADAAPHGPPRADVVFPAQEARAAPRSVAPVEAAPAAPLPAPAAGVDVQGTVLRQAAHLRIDAGPLGDLALHLRVRGDTLHLRAEGEAAPAVEAQRGALSRALASAGLELGAVELTPADAGSRSSGHGSADPQRDQRQGWSDGDHPREPAPREPAPRGGRRTGAPRATTPATRRDGQVDVDA